MEWMDECMDRLPDWVLAEIIGSLGQFVHGQDGRPLTRAYVMSAMARPGSPARSSPGNVGYVPPPDVLAWSARARVELAALCEFVFPRERSPHRRSRSAASLFQTTGANAAAAA
jgi:hypothetical protein